MDELLKSAAGPMELAKVTYWTFAFGVLLAAVVCAISGVRQIRRADVLGHRRQMLRASALIAAFVVSYPFKLIFMGREVLATWDPFYVTALRVHESFIAVMLVTTALALWNARVLNLRQARDGHAGAIAAAKVPSRLRLHRRCGRIAVIAAVGSIATASAVLYGMYDRVVTF